MRFVPFYLIILIVAVTHTVSAQLLTEGKVVDKSSGKPVPFCAIGLKGKKTGVLCNEDGVFVLKQVSDSDTLLILNLGYKTQALSVAALKINPLILLEQNAQQLQEIKVYDNDNPLYQLLNECREQLLASEEKISKAYFTLSTEINRQPAELLECHYNSQQNAARLIELNFKNGRVGTAPVGNRFFVSLNTTKAITFLNLVQPVQHFPLIPLQLGIKKARKKFRLYSPDSPEETEKIYHLRFEPREKNNEAFSGELWIDKASKKLLKIILQINHSQVHPFLPLFPEAKIEDVSLLIVKTFNDSANFFLPRHLDFNYQFSYKIKDTSRLVKSKGVMFFYDYQQPFILPYFKYNQELEDYRKISLLSYNEAFWGYSNGITYTDEARMQLLYFKKNGLLLNYQKDGNLRQGLLKNKSGFFESGNLLWSDKKRVGLKETAVKRDTVSKVNPGTFLSELYKIKAQIFLDLNESGDSLLHFSATVFDTYETFYNLNMEGATNAFINIYFDLVEVERRKMEKVLKKTARTKENFEAVYKQTLKNIELMEQDYFKNVAHGKNSKELKRYNDMVLAELGLNNFEMLGYGGSH